MSKRARYKASRVKRSRFPQFLEQQHKCHYCGEIMVLNGGHDNPLTASWDHVVPRAAGGSNKKHNLVLAHKRCNELKGSLPYEDALKYKVWELNKRQRSLLVKQRLAKFTGNSDILRYMPRICALCDYGR